VVIFKSGKSIGAERNSKNKAPEVQVSLHNYFTMPEAADGLELINH